MDAPAPTATCRRTVSSSRRPASRRGFSSSSGGGGGIRTPTIRCSGRSTRMTSGPTATTPATSAISARTASSGSRSRCRPTSGSSIRRPISRRRETEVDVWRAVPTVNDVALTGPDDGILWPRGPNERGGYQLDGRFGTLQEQALAALTNHAQIQSAPPQQLLDDLSSFQRVLFTNERVRALSDAVREGDAAAARSRSPAHAARATGKGGVRTRLRPVPRRARTIDATGDAQQPSGAGDSVSQHLQPVSTPRRSSRRATCSRRVRRNSRATCAPTRSRCRLRHRALAGHPSGRGRSFAGRRPIPAVRSLTGFVGGPAPRDDWEKFDVPGLRGISRTAPYFHQQQRRHARRDARSLRRAVQARGGELRAGTRRRAADRDDRRRALRSTAGARRARRAAGVLKKL